MQQAKVKVDQMVENIKSQFDILSRHVTNVADSNTHSLKVSFVQETDLLKQDLLKVITQQRREDDAENSAQQSQQTSLQDAAYREYAPNLSQTNDSAKNPIQLAQNNYLPNHSEQKLPLLHQEQVHHHHHHPDLVECSLQEYTRDHESPAQPITSATGGNSKSLTGNSQNEPVKLYSEEAKRHSVSQAGADVSGVVSLVVREPNEFWKTSTDSMEATGDSASAFWDQQKLGQSAIPGSAGRSREPGSLRKKTADLDVAGLMPAGSKQTMFHVKINKRFVSGKEPYLSPFVYSRGKACKVLMCINIQASGSLEANVHVTKGDHDEEHTWPLTLQGTGHIFNFGSRRWTQIWQLHPVQCEKPVSRDELFVFSTSVCLVTSRGSYPDISYKDLVEKRYYRDNILSFMWDLGAK